MLLSIVVPTYNRVGLLQETVTSVLAQDSDDFELVIVDDASEDGTWDYLRDLSSVRAYRNPTRLGLAANWNRAISLSRGQYVFILQDDDLAKPNLVSTLATEAGPELMCFSMSLIDADGGNPEIYWHSVRRLLEPPDALLEYATGPAFTSTQLLFQRAVFDRLGGMDETFPIGSDAEMIMRWLISCPILMLPDVLALRRRWEGSTSAAIQGTLAMSDTMRALVSSISSRARHTLSREQLRELEDSMHAQFWVPYVLDEHRFGALADLERERPQLIASISALASENIVLRRSVADSLARERRSAEALVRSSPGTGPTKRVRPPKGLARPWLSAGVRAERRRVTFQNLVRSERGPVNGSPAPDLVSLAVTSPSAHEAITLMYSSILGRDPDPDGLAGWADRLHDGESLLSIARELAHSAEARARPPRDRARVLEELGAWESVGALAELGVSAGYSTHTYAPGRVSHTIFVEALFEVAFERRPSPEELTTETDKLIAGGGREWLIRTYADHPEVKARFLGVPSSGLRDRLRRWRKGRRYLDVFRDLVTAAEARHVTELLARLAEVDPTTLSRLRTLNRAS